MTSTSLNLHLNLVECMIVKDSEAVTDNMEQRAPSRRIPLAGGGSTDVAEAEEKEVVSEEHQESQMDVAVKRTPRERCCN